VKWYNNQRGYGFIHPAGGSKDLFVHASAVERAGQKVAYELQVDRRTGKTSAVNLQAA
jgi:CspA family cold shock protein